ncbi:hypothetical protein DM806_16790 [Sphingobium lactosutens]|uniref:hypothetical protein n=1 Tax=Sphingobium lactosutens TaxID=522773 RepID=UPI0015BD139C|nr:hypothetical protein [Sphingobium lactosutens]NWK97297.1 hypothetical protein [Sphingobium lactosutens]
MQPWHNRELRAAIQENQSAVIARIHDEAAGARGPMLAYLVLEDLKLLETLDYHQRPGAARDSLLTDIPLLATTPLN